MIEGNKGCELGGELDSRCILFHSVQLKPFADGRTKHNMDM